MTIGIERLSAPGVMTKSAAGQIRLIRSLASSRARLTA